MTNNNIGLRGAFTAMITPFNEDESVDYSGFKKNVRYQIDNGIDGIVVLGTTGETPSLTTEEREMLIKIAVEEVHGKVPVIVGTGTNNTAKCIANSLRAEQLGADALLVVTPYYNKPMPEGMFLHFKAINGAVKIPIILYNVPGRTGKNVDVATLKRIAKLEKVIAVKEASGDISQIAEICNQIPELIVLSGDDAMTFGLMAFGGSGVVSVAGNLIPGEMALLCRHMRNGRIEEARSLHFRLLPFFRATFFETNPIPIKVAMRLSGLPSGSFRLPMSEPGSETVERLKAAMLESGVGNHANNQGEC